VSNLAVGGWRPPAIARQATSHAPSLLLASGFGVITRGFNIGRSATEPLRLGRRSSLLVRLVVVATALALLLAIDLPVERMIAGRRLPGFFRDLLAAAEVFGNGFGVALVLITIATLDPGRLRPIGRLAACAFGGGLAADIVKLLIARDRPRAVDLASAHLWETFTGLFPFASAGSNGQSFPSAHTATAAGLAVGLTMLYPRGRWLFAALAVGVGVQRIMVAAHFPSDVFVGAVVGYGTASGVLALQFDAIRPGRRAHLPPRREEPDAEPAHLQAPCEEPAKAA